MRWMNLAQRSVVQMSDVLLLLSLRVCGLALNSDALPPGFWEQISSFVWVGDRARRQYFSRLKLAADISQVKS